MRKFLFLFLVTFLLAGSLANAQQLRVSAPNPLSLISQHYENTRGVLFNQIDSVAGGGSASQQFPDFTNDIIESADEFVVPAGHTWSIDSIDCVGTWSTTGPMINMRVFIYSDSGNAGIRPGAVVYADSLIVPITALSNNSPTFKLHNLAVLPAGKYWIACLTVQNFSTSGQWFWGSRTTRGALCVLRDRQNLLGGGTAWRVTTTAPNQGLAFRLRGVDATAPTFAQITSCRNGLNISVPDNDPVTGATDSMTIGLIHGCTIVDVNLKIDTLTHTWDSDMEVRLLHGAQTVTVFNGVGGSGDNFIGTLLNDSASTPIASGTSPFTGSFQPQSPLSAFNTTATNGAWKLRLFDHAAADLGVLKAWCVIVSYQCPTGGIQTVEIPNTYKLSQNYPNPFNPTTTISYGLPKNGNVSLVIYDVLGREVRTLVNEFKTSGTYNVSFDASSLASGVYFYTLKSNDFTSTKKMLLVK